MYQSYTASDQFMPDLMKDGKTIVFLVPSQLFTHPQAGVTKEEMEFLLKDSKDRMKNVYFVFGAYEALSKGQHARYVAQTPFKTPRYLDRQYQETVMHVLFEDMQMMLHSFYHEKGENPFEKTPGAIYPETYPGDEPEWMMSSIEDVE